MNAHVENTKNIISVSTVTPVYAGEDYLEKLVSRIGYIRDEWASRNTPMKLCEAIFVDDASRDGSSEILRRLEERYSWVRVVTLSRNFGQHRATIAGVLHSSSDWLVTLDEDLQHDPALIEKLLARAANESADIVFANGDGNTHGGSGRDFTSRAAKSLIGRVTGNPYVKNFNSFRLIRGVIGRAAASVCSYGTYFDMALCWFTRRITTIEVSLKDLRYIDEGTSSYNFRKLLSHAWRLVTSSETKVLRVAAIMGVIAMAVSVAIGFSLLVLKLMNPTSIDVQGWTSLILTILFIGGLVIFQLGIVLEFISILVMRAQGKPTFFTIDRSSDQVLLEYFRTQNLS
jgi:glycosyltransferase involved in cell wall biosynthesis